MEIFTPSYKKQKTFTFDEDSINSSKNCIPGPNVVFPNKRELTIGQYLENVNNMGSLGCNPNQYPKFTNNKYCCVEADQKSNPQEILDYVNGLLEYAMANVNPTVFNKYLNVIDFLIDERKEILLENKNLQDNIQLDENFKNIDEWYEYSKKEANAIQDYRPNPVPENSFDNALQTITKHHTIQNKKRTSHDMYSRGGQKKKTKKCCKYKLKLTNKKQHHHKRSYKNKKYRKQCSQKQK
jgi:hypothetical protein